MAEGWPVELAAGPVRLRPLRRSDGRAWTALRERNAAWLRPWEATLPGGPGGQPVTFGQYRRMLEREARRGVTLPFALDVDGELAGRLTVSQITYGPLRSGTVGYWIGEEFAGRGAMPVAVALAADHCFTALRLHRIEINVRPENTASLRVVEKLGFREEGVRRLYLHIAGAWRDHRTFALTVEEVPDGLLGRVLPSPAASPPPPPRSR